ncbi:MAG: TolC family protein [Xanthobacteraceae bacterium]|jgi:cobalt-zinc-cadmium efflux system outer membrane protein
MLARRVIAYGLVIQFLSVFFIVTAQAAPASKRSGALTLARALQLAAASNPRMGIAGRDIGIAAGHRLQSGAYPNPEVGLELDNAAGSGNYRGLRSAETTLQISQLIELGGKRDARVAASSAGLQAAHWQRAAVRLEILSDTAVAFYSVLAAQRRISIYDTHIAALERLTPLLQRRVEAGASSPAEVARARVAVDFVRADREKARTVLAVARLELATLMGRKAADFPYVVGNLTPHGRPPSFQTIQQALDSNPQLAKFNALRAQRDAELLLERLKPVPDLRAGVAWRHYRDTNDNAVRFGVSIPLPVWDQNLGNIAAARETRAKVDAEQAVARATLLLTLGRAYQTLSGVSREIAVLHSSAVPNIRSAVEGMESGYAQGRYTLLELLDVQSSAAEAAVRELEAQLTFYTSLATIEGLTGMPLRLAGERSR